MKKQTSAIDRLIALLSRLPGVGEKTARRFVFFILNAPADFASDLSNAITEVRERSRLCSLCCDVTEEDPCAICRSPHRDEHVICVVERPTDVMAIEKTGEFQGRYHVLHGVISPLEGIGPEDIKIAPLLVRLRSDGIKEVIVATNPSVNGEATATYIHRMIAPMGIAVTRIALGLPVGADIEFADKVTLGRALAHRRPI